MKRDRRARIIATLGPATSERSAIESLFLAGADVFRLNFSHGTQGDHQNRLQIVRALERKYERPIAVMADLQGPKLRVSTMRDGGVGLVEGGTLRLELGDGTGTGERVFLPHPEVFHALRPDADVLLDDGKIRLRITVAADDHALAEVVTGGRLSDRKGVNVPHAVLPLAALTPKDHSDLEFAIENGVDWIALSFVQRPEDLREARELVGDRAAILSKLEKPAAIRELDGIIALSDAIMVARGDLGVELPPENVPGIQKLIVRSCRQAGKPVVIATQMLESMIDSPTPTRAEASDVATAVYDGVDAVMLSAETASGSHATETVATMDRIIAQVERDEHYRATLDTVRANPERTSADAITAAARRVAETIETAAIATFTTSGSTTLRAARERPTVPILCLTPSQSTARRLNIAWGVHPVICRDVQDFADMVEKAGRFALHQGLAKEGDRLVVTAGTPFGVPGNTNVLRIVRI